MVHYPSTSDSAEVVHYGAVRSTRVDHDGRPVIIACRRQAVNVLNGELASELAARQVPPECSPIPWLGRAEYLVY